MTPIALGDKVTLRKPTPAAHPGPFTVEGFWLRADPGKDTLMVEVYNEEYGRTSFRRDELKIVH